MIKPILYIVTPCYNEEEVIEESLKVLVAKLDELINNKTISLDSKIVFVNDGSKDNTKNILKQHKTNNTVIISLSTNKGHQNALWAGLEYSKDKCDCVISIDCDLQDDINLINSFVEKFMEGYEIVYGVRNDRTSDTLFKRQSANFFYNIMSFLGTKIVKNHADYRLISNNVLNKLMLFDENNLFLRGIIPTIGFKSCNLFYKRNERFAGNSKYPFFKMLSFAINGITSFSIQPLRILTFLGIVLCVFSIIFGIYALIANLLGKTIPGWTSIVIPIYLLGGVQMLGLGVLGEYIGKIYSEVKNRPKYFIEDIIE